MNIYNANCNFAKVKYLIVKFYPVNKTNWYKDVITYHLPYSVKAFPMELKSLFEQHLIFDGPLIRERGEICQVHGRSVKIMFVPKQHTKCLFTIVTIFFFSGCYVFVH